jgi:hypothetical protein
MIFMFYIGRNTWVSEAPTKPVVVRARNLTNIAYETEGGD